MKKHIGNLRGKIQKGLKVQVGQTGRASQLVEGARVAPDEAHKSCARVLFWVVRVIAQVCLFMHT